MTSVALPFEQHLQGVLPEWTVLFIPVTKITAADDWAHHLGRRLRRWCVHREGMTLHHIKTNASHQHLRRQLLLYQAQQEQA